MAHRAGSQAAANRSGHLTLSAGRRLAGSARRRLAGSVRRYLAQGAFVGTSMGAEPPSAPYWESLLATAQQTEQVTDSLLINQRRSLSPRVSAESTVVASPPPTRAGHRRSALASSLASASAGQRQHVTPHSDHASRARQTPRANGKAPSRPSGAPPRQGRRCGGVMRRTLCPFRTPTRTPTRMLAPAPRLEPKSSRYVAHITPLSCGHDRRLLAWPVVRTAICCTLLHTFK